MVPELSLNAWMRFDSIRRAIRSTRPARILEIGIGQGAMGAWLAQQADYTGVEHADSSRVVAARRIANAGAVLDSLPDGEFDLVCAFEVVEHIDDDVGALRLWSTRLRPGGTLLLSVPAHQDRFGPSDEAVGHYRRYDRARLIDVVTAAGFDSASVRAHGFPLGYALDAARNRLASRDLARNADLTMEQRTAASGRWLQATGVMTRLIAIAALPFRLVQRPFASSELGTGWVLVATKPQPSNDLGTVQLDVDHIESGNGDQAPLPGRSR